MENEILSIAYCHAVEAGLIKEGQIKVRVEAFDTLKFLADGRVLCHGETVLKLDGKALKAVEAY